MTQNDAISILIWLLILLAIILAGFVLVYLVRRKLKVTDDISSNGFTLADLREMRRQGKMSEEEFARAKTVLLASIRAREGPSKDPPKE